nr:putative replication associated protein [Crucivirus sp.]
MQLRYTYAMTTHDWPIWMDSDAFESKLVDVRHDMPAPQPTETKTSSPVEPVKDSKWYKQRACNWCFTIFGYTPELVEQMKTEWPDRLAGFKCLMWEPEICPDTKRPHLQGFICYEQVKSGKQITDKLMDKCRWSVMREPVVNNVIYCSKDKVGITIIGTLPISNAMKGALGKTMGPWNQLKERTKAGASITEIDDEFTDLAGKFPNGVDRIYNRFKPKGEFNLITKYGSLYPWQKDLLDIIELGANARSVIWCWEAQGDTGKSFFVKHLAVNHGFQPLTNAATRDIACAWERGNVCIDYARTDSTERNYDIIEKIKNGLMFSAKYQSCTKFSEQYKDVHVICFANEPPDVTKLSMDRWRIYNIVDKKLVPQAARDLLPTFGMPSPVIAPVSLPA